MDIIDFVENVLGLKLLDYQKKLLIYVDEHPDCTIPIPRGRSTPCWIQAFIWYRLVKAMEEIKDKKGD